MNKTGPKTERSIFSADALAIQLLDFYEGGEWAWEEDGKKTDKQLNLKREFKKAIEEQLNEPSKQRFFTALHEGFLEHEEPHRLREENRLLREFKRAKESRTGDEKECLRAIYLDEIRQEERELAQQNYIDRQASLERNVLRYRAHIDKLEGRIDGMRASYVPKSELEDIRKQNLSLIEESVKKKKSKKDIKKEKLMKQLSDLKSSSSSEEENSE